MGIPKLRSRLIKLGGIQKRMRSTESRQAYTKTMRLPANLPMLPECLSPFLTLNSNSALVPFRRGSCRRNRGRLDARAALRVPGQRGTGDVGRAMWDGQRGTGNVGQNLPSSPNVQISPAFEPQCRDADACMQSRMYSSLLQVTKRRQHGRRTLGEGLRRAWPGAPLNPGAQEGNL